MARGRMDQFCLENLGVYWHFSKTYVRNLCNINIESLPRDHTCTKALMALPPVNQEENEEVLMTCAPGWLHAGSWVSGKHPYQTLASLCCRAWFSTPEEARSWFTTENKIHVRGHPSLHHLGTKALKDPTGLATLSAFKMARCLWAFIKGTNNKCEIFPSTQRRMEGTRIKKMHVYICSVLLPSGVFSLGQLSVSSSSPTF